MTERRTSHGGTPGGFWAKLVPASGGCLEWPTDRKNGYGHTTWHGTEISTHRLAWILTNGPLDGEVQVLHTCDNPPCCNPEHLFPGTHDSNMKDKTGKGRYPRAYASRMSDDQVAELRQLYHSENLGAPEIARRLGLSSEYVVWQAAWGKTYKHLPMPTNLRGKAAMRFTPTP